MHITLNLGATLVLCVLCIAMTWTFTQMPWGHTHTREGRHTTARSVTQTPPCAQATIVESHREQVNSISKRESFDFFDYEEEPWKLKKNIHEQQSKKQVASGVGGNGRTYYQYHWEPSWSCDFEERIGPIGDGGKWVCDTYKIKNKTECFVLSIGSNNDFSFEDGIHNLNPNCQIHTFDHTVVPVNVPPFVTFHDFGLANRDEGKLVTMKSALKLAGLSGKHIDILKIDCEGCEYDVFPEFFQGFIRQVLIELHYTNEQSNDNFFESMAQHGYVIFHKEPNTYGCGGDCIEYSFLRLNLKSPGNGANP